MSVLRTAAALRILMIITFLGGLGSSGTHAQQGSAAGQSAEKLPPDVHPDTLCRAARVKREDLTTDEEKQAFDRIVALTSPDSKEHLFKGWLGTSGIRMQIPEVAEIYLEQSAMIREKSGLEPKYRELVALVATRESDNKSEFLIHASREITQKQLGPKVVEVVRNRQDTKGLEEKEALIIQFGRELFNQPKVSSKTFAAVERNFGRKATLGITLTMGWFESNMLLMRAYDTQLLPSEDAKAKPTSSLW